MMLGEDILKSIMASSVSSKEKSNKDAKEEVEFDDV